MCRDVGVVPIQYHTDNGSSFTSGAFANQLATFKQMATFAGVGAHHHNGIAERSIQTIMSCARTMMLHSAIHWPDVANPILWPMAVSQAVYLHNHVPDPATGLSLSDVFTRTRWPHSRFHDLHVWGCPIYVLEKAIQDGKKLPRWKPRSTRRMNMG
jgi:transposase InsO family protein